MLYLWVKTLHVLAIVSWMAGLLYLPRLFVYHADVEPDSDPGRLFALMEFRLYRYIMSPAMIVAWLTGLHMAVSQGYWADIWFLSKLALVIAMSGVHGYLGALRRRFAHGENQRSSRFFRVLNEVPTVLMIFIIGLVILKPFT
jgi:protoporphyrinogen IX oxidase